MRGSILLLLKTGGQITLWACGGFKHTSSDSRSPQAIVQDASFLLIAILVTLIWSLLIAMIEIGLLL
jgi:hypothetical protein